MPGLQDPLPAIAAIAAIAMITRMTVAELIRNLPHFLCGIELFHYAAFLSRRSTPRMADVTIATAANPAMTDQEPWNALTNIPA